MIIWFAILDTVNNLPFVNLSDATNNNTGGDGNEGNGLLADVRRDRGTGAVSDVY